MIKSKPLKKIYNWKKNKLNKNFKTSIRKEKTWLRKTLTYRRKLNLKEKKFKAKNMTIKIYKTSLNIKTSNYWIWLINKRIWLKISKNELLFWIKKKNIFYLRIRNWMKFRVKCVLPWSERKKNTLVFRNNFIWLKKTKIRAPIRRRICQILMTRILVSMIWSFWRKTKLWKKSWEKLSSTKLNFKKSWRRSSLSLAWRKIPKWLLNIRTKFRMINYNKENRRKLISCKLDSKPQRRKIKN